MRKIEPKALEENVFSLFDDQWALITAGTAENCNTMTASWGGLGVLWHRPVATIYVRPQRYTYEFIEREDYFSLSFFEEEWREQLSYCGTASGREEDKFAACGFHVEYDQAPYIREARLVLLCKKLYHHDLDPAHFPPEAREFYDNDYHRMYIGEIVQVLRS